MRRSASRVAPSAMGAAAGEADRTLFVCNLDPGVTEELLFELFLQGGPVVKVKIPKDQHGRGKPFAFVNFKHKESVPYGISLLNGIKLFGRPLKIQFRSGSSHASQDNGAPFASPDGGLPAAPQHQPQPPPATNTNNWYERSAENFSAASSSSVSQSFSSFSPENLQRQTMLVSSRGAWQQQACSPRADASFPFPPPPCRPSPRHHEAPAPPPPPHKVRPASRLHLAEGRHYGREQQPPTAMSQWGGDPFHPRRGWSYDYDPHAHSRREGKWQRPSRH